MRAWPRRSPGTEYINKRKNSECSGDRENKSVFAYRTRTSSTKVARREGLALALHASAGRGPIVENRIVLFNRRQGQILIPMA